MWNTIDKIKLSKYLNVPLLYVLSNPESNPIQSNPIQSKQHDYGDTLMMDTISNITVNQLTLIYSLMILVEVWMPSDPHSQNITIALGQTFFY